MENQNNLNNIDSENKGQEAQQEKQEEILESKIYKCPSCGNFLSYDPKSNKLKCEYCDTLVELQAVEGAKELPYHQNVENQFIAWQGVKSIRCRSCGAVTMLSQYETAAKCPFCGASNIVELDEIPGLQPNGILPFRISKEDVHVYYKKWLKGKHLAPFKLKKEATKQPSQGVYIPVFTFDSMCNGTYTIRYGKHYTVTVGTGKNRHTETRTRWYLDSGVISNFFNDIQVEASKSIDQKTLSKLGGFDTDNSSSYHNQFISGYSAERYDKSLDESFSDAVVIMDSVIKQMIISRYNADVVDYVNMNNSYNDITYKYILVPIWVFSYKYQKKTYGCIANGRTGKIIGKYPKSPFKISAIVLAVGAVVALAVWIYIKYFM